MAIVLIENMSTFLVCAICLEMVTGEKDVLSVCGSDKHLFHLDC